MQNSYLICDIFRCHFRLCWHLEMWFVHMCDHAPLDLLKHPTKKPSILFISKIFSKENHLWKLKPLSKQLCPLLYKTGTHTKKQTYFNMKKKSLRTSQDRLTHIFLSLHFNLYYFYNRHNSPNNYLQHNPKDAVNFWFSSCRKTSQQTHYEIRCKKQKTTTTWLLHGLLHEWTLKNKQKNNNI